MDEELLSLVNDLPDELDIGVTSGVHHQIEADNHDTSTSLGLTEWCDGCRSLRKELDKATRDHHINYNVLKQKIIQTDLLIKRYNAKCQECDGKAKMVDAVNLKLDKVQRDCDSLAKNLKTTLEEGEPLRKSKERLEKQKDSLRHQVQELETKVQALEIMNKQILTSQKAHATKADKLDSEQLGNKARIKELESSLKKTEIIMKKCQDEAAAKKKENLEYKQQQQKQARERKKHEKRIAHYEAMLVKHGLHYAINSRTGRQSCDSSIVSHDLSEDWETCTTDSVVEEDDLDAIFLEMGVFDTDETLKPLLPILSPLPPSPAPSQVAESGDDSSSDESAASSDGDLESVADLLEGRLLCPSPRKSPRLEETSVGPLESSGLTSKTLIIQPTLRLQRQFSLDDSELDDLGSVDIPFNNFKSRENSRDCDESAALDEGNVVVHIDELVNSEHVHNTSMCSTETERVVDTSETRDVNNVTKETATDVVPMVIETETPAVESIPVINKSNESMQTKTEPVAMKPEPIHRTDYSMETEKVTGQTGETRAKFEQSYIHDKVEENDNANQEQQTSGHVIKAADHVTGHVAQTADHVIKAADHVTGHVTQAADHVTGHVIKAADHVTGHVIKAADHVTGHVIKAADHDVTGHVTQTADHVTGHVMQVADHVTGHVIKTADHVTGHVIKAADHVTGHVIKAADHVTGHVIKAADHVIKAADHVTGHVIKVADHATGHVTQPADHVMQVADHVTQDNSHVTKDDVQVIEKNPSAICDRSVDIHEVLLTHTSSVEFHRLPEKTCGISVDLDSKSLGTEAGCETLVDRDSKSAVGEVAKSPAVVDGGGQTDTMDTDHSGIIPVVEGNIVENQRIRSPCCPLVSADGTNVTVPCGESKKDKSESSFLMDPKARRRSRSMSGPGGDAMMTLRRSPRYQPITECQSHDPNVDGNPLTPVGSGTSKLCDLPGSGSDAASFTEEVQTESNSSKKTDENLHLKSIEGKFCDIVAVDDTSHTVVSCSPVNKPPQNHEDSENSTNMSPEKSSNQVTPKTEEVSKPNVSAENEMDTINMDSGGGIIADSLMECDNVHTVESSQSPVPPVSHGTEPCVAGHQLIMKSETKESDISCSKIEHVQSDKNSCVSDMECVLNSDASQEATLQRSEVVQSAESCTEGSNNDVAAMLEEAALLEEPNSEPKSDSTDSDDFTRYSHPLSLPKQASTGFDVMGVEDLYFDSSNTCSPVIEGLQSGQSLTLEHEPWSFPTAKRGKSPSRNKSPVKFFIRSDSSDEPGVELTACPLTPCDLTPEVSDERSCDSVPLELPLVLTTIAEDMVGSPVPARDDDDWGSLSPVSLTWVDELPSMLSPLSDFGDCDTATMTQDVAINSDVVEDTVLPTAQTRKILTTDHKIGVKSDDIKLGVGVSVPLPAANIVKLTGVSDAFVAKKSKIIPKTVLGTSKTVAGTSKGRMRVTRVSVKAAKPEENVPLNPIGSKSTTIDDGVNTLKDEAMDTRAVPKRRVSRGVKPINPPEAAPVRTTTPSPAPSECSTSTVEGATVAPPAKSKRKGKKARRKMKMLQAGVPAKQPRLSNVSMPKQDQQVIEREILLLLRFDSVLPAETANKLQMTNINPKGIIDVIIKHSLDSSADMISSWHSKCQGKQLNTTKPWLTERELKFVELVKIMDSKNQECGVLAFFMETIQTTLRYPPLFTPPPGLQSLCRMFVSLCRGCNELERCRVFVYDLVYFKMTTYPTLVCSVAVAWPLVLVKDKQDISPVIRVLEYVIMVKCLHSDKNRLQMMSTILKKLCNWEKISVDQEALTGEILSKLRSSVTTQPACVFDCERALDLLACHEDWSWSNDVLVRSHLWPVLQQWSSAREDKPPDQLVQTTLRLLGSVMSHCPRDKPDAAKQTMMTLHALLHGPQATQVSRDIQMAAIHSIVRLSSFDPDQATLCLQTWMQTAARAEIMTESDRDLVKHCLQYHEGRKIR